MLRFRYVIASSRRFVSVWLVIAPRLRLVFNRNHRLLQRAHSYGDAVPPGVQGFRYAVDLSPHLPVGRSELGLPYARFRSDGLSAI